MLEARRVLVVGVGGQGVVLAGNILADVALAAGHDVKKSEVHGMSKRGGIVFSHVCYGPVVHSPLIRTGEADALVAFEWAEGLRWRSSLRPGGVFVAGTTQIVPPAAQLDHRTWARAYPAFDRTVLGDHDGPAQAVDAVAVARRAGSARVANSVLLGALSVHLDLPQSGWEETIVRHVPARTGETNVRAFREGRALASRSPEPSFNGVRESQSAPSSVSFALPPRLSPIASSGGPEPQRPACELEITPAWCKGCGICVRVCPEACLRLDDRAVVEVADAAACTGCRLCEWLCPDFAITTHLRAAHGAGTP